eukprot:Seg4375.1 transcript_id=Seg4375.1/GoldUCD/mRNA.D3Y31 product="hypothetical protein" protein_id=Seg4375.1/GoldUCD/D3Y31
MKRFAVVPIDEGALEEETRRDRQRRLVASINRHEEPRESRRDELYEEREARPNNSQPTTRSQDEEAGETTSNNSSQNNIMAQTRGSQVSCTCSTTCSRRTKKKPGCVCKDAGVQCTAQYLCGTKKRGKITKQCKDGKPAVNMEENVQDVPPHESNTVTGFLRMEQEIEKAKKDITDYINSLSREQITKLVVELAASGQGSTQYIKDLVAVLDKEIAESSVKPTVNSCQCRVCQNMPTEDEKKCCDR